MLLVALVLSAATASGGSTAVAAATGQTEQEASDAPDPMSPEVLAAELGPDWYSSGDVAFKAEMDEDGYHLFKAREDEGFAWRHMATIQPNRIGEVAWTGYYCVSGTGRHLVAVVAPAIAANRPVLRDRGGFAYDVDTSTGVVRPIVGAVALKYHSPGCGVDDRAVLSRGLGFDQEATELLSVDLASAKVDRVIRVAGQVTSAVPIGRRIIAAMDKALVEVIEGRGADATQQVLARLPGVPFSLRPTGQGGIDLLTAEPADRSRIWRLQGRSVRELGHGALSRLRLHAGRGGRSVVTGAEGVEPTSGIRAVGDAGTRAEASSLDGDVILGRPKDGSGLVLVSARTNRVLDRRPPTRGRPAATAVPGPGTTAAPGVAGLANTTVPTCAVPRNQVNRQAPQPVRQRVDWAIQMGTRGLLTTARGFARPAGFANMGLAAYAPNDDFSRRVLSGGTSSTPIPPPVLQGIMAQESAWRQASRRALPGEAGNPNVSDYYGAAGGLSVIDYSEADCGYGLGQITTGMRASDAAPYSANGKTKIAIDYQENITAGVALLGDLWNRLYALNIKANNANPQYLENWYLAIWAYNTGLNPRNAGCLPSPTCTDSAGHWGLGWTNNPRNADYAPNRSGFLRETYADAEHPASWPYQERVFGWMETPILDYQGDASYGEPVYASGRSELQIPTFDRFCSTTANFCDPTYDTEGSLSYCTMNDVGHERHCWWSLSASWVADNCASSCARGSFTYLDNSTEPASIHPHPPACSVDQTQLPPSPAGPPIIVNDTGDPPLNVVGCATGAPPARNWSNAGTFTYTPGTDGAGTELGIIDTHQLGVGFGGRVLFSKARSAATPELLNTGTWSPTLPAGSKTYAIKVHIPSAAASVSDATYTVHRGDGTTATRTIDQHIHENRWVSLGNYVLAPGAKLVLTNQSTTTPGVLNVAFDAAAFTPLQGTTVTRTLDAVAPIDPNQDFNTAAAGAPMAAPFNSVQSLYDLGRRLSDDLSNAANACSTPGHTNPCVGSAVGAAATTLAQRVATGGSSVKNPYVNGTDTVGLWAGLSNYRPTATVTQALLDDEEAWKIRHRITVRYSTLGTGAIDPASVDVSLDALAGDSALMPFMVSFMQGLGTDHGIAPPDLRYYAYDLTRANHDITNVDPLTVGHVPGRAYRPYLAPPTVSPDGACVRVKAISGGAAGYKPMVLDDAVRGAAGAWRDRVRAAADAGTVRSSAADAAAEMYKFQFKAGNTADLWNGFNSPWWFAPAIWVQNNVDVCTSGIQFRPSGLDGRIAYQSFMPTLYQWTNGTQLIDLTGANLQPVSASEARPAQTGDVFRVSQPPESYPPGWFTEDQEQGVPLNPWDSCDFAPPRPRSTNLLRNGSPWKLSFYENIEQTPAEVRFCDDPPGLYHGGEETS